MTSSQGPGDPAITSQSTGEAEPDFKSGQANRKRVLLVLVGGAILAVLAAIFLQSQRTPKPDSTPRLRPRAEED